MDGVANLGLCWLQALHGGSTPELSGLHFWMECCKRCHQATELTQVVFTVATSRPDLPPLWACCKGWSSQELCVGSLESGYFNLKILSVAIVIVTITWFVPSSWYWTHLKSTQKTVGLYSPPPPMHAHWEENNHVWVYFKFKENNKKISLACLNVKYVHFLTIYLMRFFF